MLSGQDKLSGKLSSIADKADDVSDAMEDAAESATVLSGALNEVESSAEDAEDEVSSLERSVNSLNRSMTRGAGIAEAYGSALEGIDDIHTSETLHTLVTIDVDEPSLERAKAAIETLPDEHVVTVKSETEDLSEAAEAAQGASEVESEGRPFTLGPQVEGLLSGRLFAPDISLFGDLSGVQMPWQDAPTPDIPEGMGDGDVPDDITVPVKFEPEGMAQVKATAAALERTTDIDIPVSPDLSLDDASTEVDGADSWRANVRDSLESVLSRMDDIDIGEKLLPDLSGRDGSWDIDLPDLGDMDWPSKPPPIPDIGIPDIDLPDIDLPDMGRGLSTITRGISEAVSGLSTFGRVGGRVLSMVGRLATKAGGAFASMSSVIGTLPSLGVVLGIGGIAIWSVFGTVLGAISAIVAAIGGLVTAIAGLGAALAGIIGMGLIKKGEQFAATSEEIEGTMEGIQAYLKSLKPLVEAAIKPLRSLPTGNFLDGLISGGIAALGDFSTMVKQLFPDIQGMFSRLGEIWSANQPEFFAELESTIRAFLPMLEGFIGWFISAAPDALALMRNMGTKLLPKVVDMFAAIWDNIRPFIPAGAAMVSILMDLTTIFFEIMAPISQLSGMTLGPALKGLAAGLGLVKDGVLAIMNPIQSLISTVKRWMDAIYSAILNLNPSRFGAIVKNAVLGVLGRITSAFTLGLNVLYKTVLSMIKRIPGASSALKALNAGSKALGHGKAVPNTLLGGKRKKGGMFEGMMTDLQPKKPGLQTGPGQGPGGRATGAPRQPYSDNRTEVNIKPQGDMMSPREQKRSVRRAMQLSRRYERRSSSPHN